MPANPAIHRIIFAQTILLINCNLFKNVIKFIEKIKRGMGMEKDEMVCYCNHVTKGQIIGAMDHGARTLNDIRKITGACTKGKCKELSPRKT